jgi:hypothetical protein
MGFSERFPRWTSAILGVAQLILTVAIIGLEVGSAYIDLAHGTIWVGFWAGLVFIVTCLMMLFISSYSLFLFYLISIFLFSLLLPRTLLRYVRPHIYQ